MAADPLETFLTGDVSTRLAEARDPAIQKVLRAYLGDAACDEYLTLASQPEVSSHLGVSHASNIVFVPGVMGSLLLSRTKGGVWWIDVRTRGHLDDLRLAPNGLVDHDAVNAIEPFTSDPSYEPFLSAVLARDDFGHRTFPYDWRKSMRCSADALLKVVRECYEENGSQPVNLVAHSMGGLMVRAALLEHSEELWKMVRKIVFIATPHYGATAIAGYLKNHFWGFDLMVILGRYLSRATFRSLWGVLQLLPAPRGVYPGTRPGEVGWSAANGGGYLHPCANFNLYRAESWGLDLTTEEAKRLQDVLDGAADFHREIYAAHLALSPEQKSRMLVIAGVGYQTLFRLEYRDHLFGAWTTMEKVTARKPGDPHREGDGRVPLASAALEDVQIRYVRGIHGGLPNVPAVYEDVFRWLNEKSLLLPDTPAQALASHLSGASESAAPHLDGTASAVPFGDDPGFLRLSEMSDAQCDDFLQRLEEDTLPEFNRVRLM